MAGPTKPRTRDRRHRVELRGRCHWLLLGAALWGAALAAAPQSEPEGAPPPTSQPPPAQQPKPQPPPADSSQADDGLIEFLGSDDVGDAAWWEFLNKAPPRGGNPPAAPPQDARR